MSIDRDAQTRAEAKVAGAFLVLGLTALYIAFMLLAVRPLAARFVARLDEPSLTPNVVALIFAALLLDSQNRLIRYVELFRGTLAQTSVYPREVVKTALLQNAAAMIFAHNHPSGVAEPSRADELLTQALRQALRCVPERDNLEADGCSGLLRGLAAPTVATFPRHGRSRHGVGGRLIPPAAGARRTSCCASGRTTARSR